MVYESPEIRILGSVEELTLNHQNNKIGITVDVLTPQLSLVGSIVPIPHN